MTGTTSEESNNLKRKIKQMILNALNISDIQPDTIDDHKSLFDGTNTLTLDSVDGIEIIMAIQRVFGVRLNDQNLARHIIQSVDTIATFIQEEKAKV